jgi:hypothetical protein
MIVREFIEYLQKLPQEAFVAYTACSCPNELEASDIHVIRKEEKKVAKHHNLPGAFMEYKEQWLPGLPPDWWQLPQAEKDKMKAFAWVDYPMEKKHALQVPVGFQPEWVDVIVLPGN